MVVHQRNIGGELTPGVSPAGVIELVNRHFGIRTPAGPQIDEFAADIPLVDDHARNPPDRVDLL